MVGRLQGHHAIITGAAGGIGLETANLFCAEGANVALIDIDEAKITSTTDYIASANPDHRAIGFTGDVVDEDICTEIVRHAARELGRPNILVNCAGSRAHQPLSEAQFESWHDILGVNLMGAQNMAKAVLPHLRRAENSSIVNVASVFGAVGRRGMGQYDASKAALISLTKTLAAEEAEHGIRANSVCPGSVWTPYTASRAAARGMTEEDLRDTGAVPSLLNRWAEPKEIAFPILWLASAEASFITGTTLMVDGGFSTVVRA